MKKFWPLFLLLSVLPLLADAPDAARVVVIRGHIYHTGYKAGPKKAGRSYISPSAQDIPDSYDSSADGSSTPIKDQGSCGSCWDFARTSSLESAAIVAGVAQPGAIDLAEQDTLINDNEDSGCNGGDMNFDYEINHGVTLEANCPYTASDWNSCSGAVAVKGLQMAYVGTDGDPTDDELRAAIYQYKSVAVTTAAGSSFDTDSSGEFVGCDDRGINHMVSLVGYRKAADGTWEYKMKNSWGTGWGKDGYGWLAKGCEETATGSDSAMVVSVAAPTPPAPMPTTDVK